MHLDENDHTIEERVAIAEASIDNLAESDLKVELLEKLIYVKSLLLEMIEQGDQFEDDDDLYWYMAEIEDDLVIDNHQG